MSNRHDGLLRQVLTVNGWVTGATGIIVALFAETADRWLGSDTVVLVRLVGVGLVVFATFVLAVARAHGQRLRYGGQAILLADGVWVIASVVAVAAGWFETVGTILVLLIAAAVALFAIGEAIGLRRIGEVQTPNAPREAKSLGLRAGI